MKDLETEWGPGLSWTLISLPSILHPKAKTNRRLIKLTMELIAAQLFLRCVDVAVGSPCADAMEERSLSKSSKGLCVVFKPIITCDRWLVLCSALL